MKIGCSVMTLNVLEAEGYDFELAGAPLIAHDAARAVSADTQRRLREILESDALMEELTNQIIVSSPRNDPEHVRRCEMLIRNLREVSCRLPRSCYDRSGVLHDPPPDCWIHRERSSPSHFADSRIRRDKKASHTGIIAPAWP